MFDHCSLILDTTSSPHLNTLRPSSQFRFEQCGANDKDGIDIVHKTWSNTSWSIYDKIKTIGSNLHKWQGHKRSKSITRIKILQRHINAKLRQNLSTNDEVSFLADKDELHRLLHIQEAYWAQRSRTLWLAQ
ncbi:hypothetical protein V6N13_030137 [Hibiscus sabdariffa]